MTTNASQEQCVLHACHACKEMRPCPMGHIALLLEPQVSPHVTTLIFLRNLKRHCGSG